MPCSSKSLRYLQVKAGETQTVYLYPSLMDFTQVGSDGHRSVVTGEYTISFGVSKTLTFGMGYVEHTIQTTI